MANPTPPKQAPEQSKEWWTQYCFFVAGASTDPEEKAGCSFPCLLIYMAPRVMECGLFTLISHQRQRMGSLALPSQ
jgi:hypothetical protein